MRRSLIAKKRSYLPEQEKIWMHYYCPLHPEVVGAIAPLLSGRPDDGVMFMQLSFKRWLKR
jgi:hypothetical protein